MSSGEAASPPPPASSAHALLVFAWAAWGITRAGALFVTPGADAHRFYPLAAAVLDGSRPYTDLGFEYPPLALATFMLPAACTRALSSFAVAFALEMVLVDLVVLTTLSRLASRLGGRAARGRVLLAWVLPSALLGTLVWQRFDVVVVALSLLAIEAALAERPWCAAAWLGLGFSVKLVPALLLPLLLARLAQRRGASPSVLVPPLLVFVVVVAATFVPAALVDGRAVLSFLTLQDSRPLQLESSWALAALAWSGDASTIAYTQDAWHVLGAAAESLRGAARFVFPVVITLALACGVRRLSSRDDGLGLARGATGVLAAFALSAPTLSPQFLLWVLGPACLLVVGADKDRRLVLLIALLCALTWVLFPTWYGALVAAEPVALALLALRNALLAVVVLVAFGVALPKLPALPPRALEGAVVASLLMLLVAQNLYPVVDTDIWFHLRIGADVLATGAVPTVDAYSATAQGHPFVAHSWGSEVLLSWVHEGGAPSALPVLRALLLFVLAVLLVATVPRPSWRGPALLPIALVGVLALSGLVEMRPYLFSLVCAAALFLLLARWRAGHPRWLWLALPLTTLWANLHGSVLLVPAALVLSSVAALLSPGTGGRSVHRPLLPLGVAPLSVFAAAINPYGFGLLTHALELSLLRGDIKQWVLEWRPFFEPAHRSYAPFFQSGALVLAAFASLLLRRRRPVVELTLLAALTTLALISWRFMPYALCFAFPLAVAGLGALLRRSGVRRAPLAALLALLLALVTSTLAFGVTHASTRHVPLGLGVSRAAASGAVSLLGSSGYRGAVFNEYTDGSYLVYAGTPALRPVIDPRIDLYSPAFVAAYFASYESGGERLLRFLREHDVGAAIFTSVRGHALAQELEQSGEFRRLGVRGDGVVLVRVR